MPVNPDAPFHQLVHLIAHEAPAVARELQARGVYGHWPGRPTRSGKGAQ